MDERDASRPAPRGRTRHATQAAVLLRHYSLLRDIDDRAFDAVLRYLRQRLFVVETLRREGAPSARLRQGPSRGFVRFVWIAWLVASLFAALVASELGRHVRQRTWDGDAYGVAVCFVRLAPAAAIVAGAVAVLGALLARAPRKVVELRAFPAAEPRRIDLWIKGSSSERTAVFASEFGALLDAASAAGQTPSAAGPPAVSRRT